MTSKMSEFNFPSIPSPLTAQGAYDHVSACLAIQKKRSLGESGECVYRSPDGARCGVGHCIPDDEYKPEFDKNADDNSIGAHLLVRKCPSIPTELTQLLAAIQGAHDSSWVGEDLAKRLRQKMQYVATNFELVAGAEQAITEWA